MQKLFADTVCLSCSVVGEASPSFADTLQMPFEGYFPQDSSGFFFDFRELLSAAVHAAPATDQGMMMPFSVTVNSLLFFLFLFSFLVFSLLFHRERESLFYNFKTLFHFVGKALPARRVQVTTTQVWSEAFLIFQTLLLISLFIFIRIWYQQFPLLPLSTILLHFVGVLLALFSLFLMKLFSYKIIGTFFLRSEIREWIPFYYRLTELTGIALFLPVMLSLYLHEWADYVSGLVIFFLLINRIILIIKTLSIFVKNKIAIFYFFVYLCGVEIAPYLLLYKGVLSIIRFAGV